MRPRSSIVVFPGSIIDRLHRIIPTLTFLVVAVVSEAVRIAVILTLGDLYRTILLADIFYVGRG